MSRRLLLMAGHDKALHVLILAELLRGDGHEIAGIMVVTPFNVRRARALVRKRGASFMGQAVRRLLDHGSTSAGESPLETFHAAHGIEHRSLRAWASAHGVPRFGVRDLNSPKAVEQVRRICPELVVYGGGGILREALLEAAGGPVLNAHSGPLPEIRGMNAAEWSILFGLAPEVTVHIIDRGIDTGPTLRAVRVAVRRGDNLEVLRQRCVVAGVEALRATVENFWTGDRLAAAGPLGRQCFVLAPALRELAEARLTRRASAAAAAE